MLKRARIHFEIYFYGIKTNVGYIFLSQIQKTFKLNKKGVHGEGRGGPKANRNVQKGGGDFNIAYVPFKNNCMANFVHVDYF